MDDKVLASTLETMVQAATDQFLTGILELEEYAKILIYISSDYLDNEDLPGALAVLAYVPEDYWEDLPKEVLSDRYFALQVSKIIDNFGEHFQLLLKSGPKAWQS